MKSGERNITKRKREESEKAKRRRKGRDSFNPNDADHAPHHTQCKFYTYMRQGERERGSEWK